MKDHFIIIGGQRSGTTYLYEILNEHPEVCMSYPVRPEPKYFLEKKVHDIDKNEYYRLFFKNCSKEAKVFGEKSTSYYEKNESPELIYSALPNTKILFILRNPVNRALSNYFFSRKNELETRSLEEVFLLKKPQPQINSKNLSVNPFNYLERGNYLKYIKNYELFFQKNQIRIIIFEEFINNLREIQNLYSFLGIDNNYSPLKISNKINASNNEEIASDRVLQSLKSYYKIANSELVDYTGLNLNLWK